MIAHGHVDIEWHDNVLQVHTKGPFNLDGIQLAYEQIQASVKEHVLHTWHRVDFLDEQTLGCPEVMKVIGNSYRWSCQMESCLSVSVCCCTPLQEDMLQRFIKKTQLDINVFQSPELTRHYIETLRKN